LFNFIFCKFQYFVPVKAAWNYFPKHRGKVIGIIVAGFGFSASFIIFLAEAIINPERIEPNQDGYFGEEVSKNVRLNNF